MNIFENAEYWDSIAHKSLEINEYRACVYHCCLAAELYLKSYAEISDPGYDYKTHDIIGLYRIVSKKFKPSQKLDHIVAQLRKYFNEARYPSGNTDAYDKKFAEDFLNYLEQIKNYISNDCHISLEDLQKKFK